MSISNTKGKSKHDEGFCTIVVFVSFWKYMRRNILIFMFYFKIKDDCCSHWKTPSIFQLKLNYKVQQDANIEDCYQVLLSLCICTWLKFPENNNHKIQIFSTELRQHHRLQRKV